MTTGGVESLGCRTIRRYYLILGGLGVVTIPPRPRPDPALGVTVGHGNRAWAGRGRRRTNRTLESFILGFCCLDGGACTCACGFYVDQPVTSDPQKRGDSTALQCLLRSLAVSLSSIWG